MTLEHSTRGDDKSDPSTPSDPTTLLSERDGARNGHETDTIYKSSSSSYSHESLSDSDVDQDEELVLSGGIKDYLDLPKHGFEPIWFDGWEYPQEIPTEISEYFGDANKPSSTVQIIGSNVSVFWLFGFKHLVEAIQDPACIIEEEIVIIPNGVHAAYHLFNGYVEEGKVPSSVWKYYEGQSEPQSYRVTALFEIPGQVTPQLARHRLGDLYPLFQPQKLPDAVLCGKIQAHNHPEKTLKKVENLLGEKFDLKKDAFWFRGCSLQSLAHAMSFFIPTSQSSNCDNEFGPAIYATDDFAYTLMYAKFTGAVMIFKNPDFRSLDVWRPSRSEWQILTATWQQLPMLNNNKTTMPTQYANADIIIGPTSQKQREARKKNHFPEQSDKMQVACVSHHGCEHLAASLVAIIYITIDLVRNGEQLYFETYKGYDEQVTVNARRQASLQLLNL